jgi:hypothetical protein
MQAETTVSLDQMRSALKHGPTGTKGSN